jgi:addiction module RelE/StbE family toxin
MYRIIVAPIAKKGLKTIAKIYRKGIAEAINALSDDPYQGKPLTRELTGRYTYKVGVYRIIYIIIEKDKTLHIINAGHRATIYQ